MNQSLRQIILWRFENNLRYQMNRHKLCVSQLSKRIQIPPRTIRKWLQSEQLPREETIIKLNYLFDVNTEFWLREV